MGGERMKVLILAGGLGTRIQALFPDQPKGMIRFAGKPFLEHQMRLLARHGFWRFVLCVGYNAEQIEKYFGDGSGFGFEIDYSIENALRGTGGALRNAEQFLQERCLVLNGDTYLEMDYQALGHAHKVNRAAVGTLAVIEMVDSSRYGQIVLDQAGRTTAFREKSACAHASLVSAGVYVFEPSILEYIPPGKTISLERDVFPSVLAAGEALYGFRTPGSFIDIGTPEGFELLRAKLDG